MQKLETFRDAPISFQAMPGALRPRLREITSIVSWLYCYLAYVAMRTNDPVTVKMLAYGRLIIKEAQQHQGNGWLEYDRVFRKQATIDPSRAWNILHSDIHASTILGRSRSLGAGIYCTGCFESDHRSEQCALTYLQSPPDQVITKQRVYPRQRPETLQRICVSWNKGRCVFQENCTFQHICAVCYQRHRACDCLDTPAESEYRRNRRSAPSTRSSQPQHLANKQ